MLRAPQVLVLAVALTGVAPAEAAPRKAKAGKVGKGAQAKKSKKPNKRATQASKSSRRGKRGRRAKVVSRAIAAERQYDGLPPGFAWPPSPAMLDAGKACEDQLDRFGVAWEGTKREGRIADPIAVRDMMLGGIKYTNTWGAKASSTMDCQLALQLARIGPDLRALGIREVRFGSIYELSYIHTPRGRVLSRHAIGMAMDIMSFVDDSGREVRVIDAYKQGDGLLLGAEQLFIASAGFHNVISPKNDPVGHYHHFHVEAVASFLAAD
jgi:hypothetical protein